MFKILYLFFEKNRGLKKVIAQFLLVIFIGFIIAPSVVSLIDSDVDISYFMNITEEEIKELKTSKEGKVNIDELSKLYTSFFSINFLNKTSFFIKGYSKVYLNLLSPPPKLA